MKKLLALALLIPVLLFGRKFFPDDPLEKEPPPLPVQQAAERDFNDYFDVVMHSLGHPGQRQPKPETKQPPIAAQAVNTLGEVPDSAWFTNRIGSREMTFEEIVRGPRQGHAPSEDGPWTITGAKTQGVTPGFQIKDSAGRRFLLKFDPLDHPEMATSVDVIGAILFHDLGYNVPENYIVGFSPDRLVVGEDTIITDETGRKRPMSAEDVDRALRRVPRDVQGRLRGLASFFIPGKPLGGFRYYGTRSDDPNDIVRHEHRRDLRGLSVFAAWMNHNDSRSINTFDTLTEENGIPFIKHYLIDFGAILGSASILSNSAREGNTFLFRWKPASIQFLTLGLYVPEWMRSDYVESPPLGKIEYPRFDPDKWRPNYPNPAFMNRLPDDTYWAAKKVMSFTDQQIHAIVKEGQYSDAAAEQWITGYLIHRRSIIGKTYFAKVLPLDHFQVRDGRLQFEDLQIKYGFLQNRDYQVQWSRFDNEAETHAAVPGAAGFDLPEPMGSAPAGSYFAAKIRAEDDAKTVTVYLRRTSNNWKVVGIERTW